MSTRETLEAGRARIADPKHFIRGVARLQALDSHGHECGATDPDAVRWTARGAVGAEGGGDAVYRVLDQAASVLAPNGVACQGVLCCQEHETVMRIYDQAIKESEKEDR